MLEGVCHCGACRWTFEGDTDWATACNCTLCRRYGALWAYGYEDEGVQVTGPIHAYARRWAAEPELEIRFCPTCACVLSWRGLKRDEQGRRRAAVNLRLAEPDTVAHRLIEHFDGLETFKDLPSDGRCVRDMWF